MQRGRPKKDPDDKMNYPLRIMLTAEQRELIEQAAKFATADMSNWARPILLAAAREQVVPNRSRSRK